MNAHGVRITPRGILRTPTDASPPPAVEHALAKMEGSGTGATLGGLGLRRPTVARRCLSLGPRRVRRRTRSC